jgi:hypothetical protein
LRYHTLPRKIDLTPNAHWLRWLMTGVGVTALHLALLWSMSGGDLSGQAEPESASEVVAVTLQALPAPEPVPSPDKAKPLPDPKPPAGPPSPAVATAAVTPPAAASDAPQESDSGSVADSSPRAPETSNAAESSPLPPAAQVQSGLQPRAMTAPAPAHLLYELAGQSKGLHFSADAVLDWQAIDQTYQARMEVSAFLIGSRSQTSSGRIGSSGLQPERFSDRARREKITLFDHEAGLVRHEPGGKTLEMPAGIQDRLSVFIQLAMEMAALEQAPSPGDSWTIPVAATRTIEQWTFRWRSREELNLPAGRIMTWHLQRQVQQAGETRVDIWLAPELGFMPARLRLQQENGDIIDQRLLRR